MKPNPTIEALKAEIAALEAESKALEARLMDARGKFYQAQEAEAMAKPLTPAMKKALLAMLAGGKIETYSKSNGSKSYAIQSDAGENRIMHAVFDGLWERKMILPDTVGRYTSIFILTEHGKQAAEKLAAKAESEAA